MENKKRIALCFYGFVGSAFTKAIYKIKDNNNIDKVLLELSYEHFKKYLIDKNDKYEFDIFIHSWNYNIKDEIVKKYNPKKYIIEKVINNFDLQIHDKYIINGDKHKAKQNLSRLLGNYKLLNLVKEYKDENKIEYEQVILTRFDLAINIPFRIDNYKNNNIKIIDGFHKHNWAKNSQNFGDIKLKQFHNQIFVEKKRINYSEEQKIRIVEKLFMSSFENIYDLTRSYETLVERIKNKKIINWSPHCYWAASIGKLIEKKFREDNLIYIEKIKELYFNGMNEGDKIEPSYTALLTKQVYFRNPGVSFCFGTIKGDINRLIDIRKLMEKYDIPEKIIKNCE